MSGQANSLIGMMAFFNTGHLRTGQNHAPAAKAESPSSRVTHTRRGGHDGFDSFDEF